jgi:hypothetical protein
MIAGEIFNRQQKTAFMIPILAVSRLMDRVHGPSAEPFDLAESLKVGNDS